MIYDDRKNNEDRNVRTTSEFKLSIYFHVTECYFMHPFNSLINQNSPLQIRKKNYYEENILKKHAAFC